MTATAGVGAQSTAVGATTTTTTVAASSSATGGEAIASVTAAATGGQACEWPQASGYGVGQGQVVPENLSWQGFMPDSSQSATVAIADFFDCDGSRGINAIMVETSQFG